MNFSRRHFIVYLAVAGLMSSTPFAYAKRGGRSRSSLGRGLRHGEPCPSKAPILSFTALERCVDLDEQIIKGMRDLDKWETDLNSRSKELEELGKMIDQKRETLDRYSQYAVDEFNALVDEHHEKIDAFNAFVSSSNAAAEPIYAMVKKFNSTCGGQCYYEKDMGRIINARIPHKKN
jgi:uncharacterized protein YqeY